MPVAILPAEWRTLGQTPGVLVEPVAVQGGTRLPYNTPRSLVQTATRPGSMVTVPPSGSGAVRGFS